MGMELTAAGKPRKRKPGGGRRTGSQNRRTVAAARKHREIIEQCMTEGITPIQVMFKNMRFWDTEAEVALEHLKEALPLIAQANPDEKVDLLKEYFATLKNVVVFKDKAQECAVDAAPYCHPRMSQISVDLPNPNLPHAPAQITVEMSLKDASAAYAALLATMRDKPAKVAAS